MKLYIIKTLFLGKDLNNKATMGLVLAENDEEIFGIVSKKWAYWQKRLDDWRYDGPNEYADRWENFILENCGDFTDDYHGEFYDQKFAWECLGSIMDEEIKTLQKFNLL
jgi:hypothetical protein